VVDDDFNFGRAGGSDEKLHVFGMEEADMGRVECKSLHRKLGEYQKSQAD
jgi:hypothetical protein